MNDKLKLLIEHYASEITTLQQLIKEEIDTEENYLAASWYQWGLSSARNEHRKLNSFNDPFYSQKDRILQLINRFKQKLSEYKEGDENYIKFSSLLRFTEEEYRLLPPESTPKIVSPQPHLFEEAIDKVFNKSIKGVYLVINEETGLLFSIVRKRSQVVVTIPYQTRRKKSAPFDAYQLKHLSKFGFEIKEKPLRLTKSFLAGVKDEANNLKTFLARCYFELLNPHGLQNQGYIEYIY